MRAIITITVTVMSLGLFGCSSLTDFDRFHGGEPTDAGMDAVIGDGGRDAGRDAGVDAGVDAGGTDAGDPDAGCGDTLTDPRNCGMCGHECADTDHASPICEGGACVNVCESGYADCNDLYDDGCETDLGSLTDCGACRVACDPGELCSMGAGCVSSCTPPEEMCGAACVDTTMSLMHCGACDAACASYMRTTATCSSGTCAYACDPTYEDCDGDLPANGCETRLMTWYVDADGDGYGALGSTGMMLCPDDAMTMGLRTNATDCDDADAARSPDAPETCNGIDDNCSGTIDEGNPGGGTSCGMDTGACMSGINNCRAGSIVCEGAVGPMSETCNDLDDDCDGMIEETFACRRGATRSCTSTCIDPDGVTVTSMGTETCSTSCTWGACVIAEVCDRADNDCDGYVDEGLLVAGPTINVGAGTFGTRVAWAESISRLGVVWRAGSPGSASWWFGEVEANGTVLGTLRLDSSYADYEGDVTFNGNNWVSVVAGEVVGGTGTGLVHYVRPGVSGGGPTLAGNGSFPPAQTGTVGPRVPRVVRRLDGSNDVGVAWIEDTRTSGNPDYVRGAIYRDLAATPSIVQGLVTSPDEDYRYAAIAPLMGGDFVCTAALVVRATGAGAIGWRRFGSGGTFTPEVLFADDPVEVGQEMTYLPGSNAILITWGQDPGMAAAASYWSLVTPTVPPTATAKAIVGTGTGARVVSGWAADPMFGLAFDPASAGTTVRRFRTSDTTPVPSDVVLGEGEVSDMTGMLTGNHRYALGFIRSGQATVRYVSCPP